MTARERLPLLAAIALLVLMQAAGAAAHDISDADRAFVETLTGPAPFPFLYLGAKHMVTGIDHIMFLCGVVFFLRRLREVVLYVSMFTIGHSLTLVGGVLMGSGLNASLVDAVIGLSVVYKAAENLGALGRIGWHFDARLAVLGFGLFHGMGLATKLMDLHIAPNGLLTNLVSFNIGVEVGQVIVLAVVVTLLDLWRHRPSFATGAKYANLLLLAGGIALTLYHLTGYVTA